MGIPHPEPSGIGNNKRSVYRSVFSNLTFWVLIAVISGALMGQYFPDTAVKMGILGTTFVDIIKLFIGPIIFLTIVLGIAGMESLGRWEGSA